MHSARLAPRACDRLCDPRCRLQDLWEHTHDRAKDLLVALLRYEAEASHAGGGFEAFVLTAHGLHDPGRRLEHSRQDSQHGAEDFFVALGDRLTDSRTRFESLLRREGLDESRRGPQD